MSRMADSMRQSARTLPQRVATEVSTRVQAEAVARCPVRTGALRASVQASASGPTVTVTALDYARFVGVFASPFEGAVKEAIGAVRN